MHGWIVTTDIDSNVSLGSLPFTWSVPELHAVGVTHVLNLCAEWHGPVQTYAQFGIEQCRLPYSDNCPIPLQAVEKGLVSCFG
jgi:atypical dual specificity phosphatase